VTRTSPTRTRTRRTPASDTALLRAIEPIGADEFLAEHWERKPLHVARCDPTRFDDLLSARDAERLVSEPGLRYPGFRLVKAGAKLDPADYTEDVSWRPVPFSATAHVPTVIEQFDAGATVILQGLHLSWTPLARYCRVLEARLGHPAQANAYFTPRHSQGLPVHHDTHDVFVLQVSGSKRWLVYDPALELPLKQQRYRAAHGEPGEVVLDVELRAGDTLYLPRGWLHEALTSDDDSLHVTVGVNVYPWIEAVRAALDRCATDVEFRRSVDREGEGLLERLDEELDPESVAREARRRFVRTRRPILDGQLRQVRALDDLGPDTVLERRETVIADLETTELGTVLLFEGKRLVFPSRIEPEVAFVVETESPFRAGELPGSLDDAGRLVLIRRLVREGFLRIVL
jgi:hypothetical protein